MKWEKIHGLMGGCNYILRGDGFYVSFNPHPFESDYGESETALVKDDEFMILNGDFRKSYENLVVQGFVACKSFYDYKSSQARSSWST